MLDFVKEAFELEKQKQKDLDIHCEVTIDGYSDKAKQWLANGAQATDTVRVLLKKENIL